MSGIIFMFHCEENTGYAIASLEMVFYEAALQAGYALCDIHFSYKKLSDDKTMALLGEFSNKLSYDFSKNRVADATALASYINRKHIRTAFVFDLNIENRLCGILRKSGISNLITYWGAPMSQVNAGIRLLLKRLEVNLRRYKPNLYVFESQAMVDSATKGRGVRESNVRLVHLGVDAVKFSPLHKNTEYLRINFNIPSTKKVFFYSGHMEPRKGVAVIVRAAIELTVRRKRKDMHFLICGNKQNEAEAYHEMLGNTDAEQHVTFAGYRDDLPILMASSYAGIIASTGWDSFTMSSVEMAASGLPLIVSDLQGLAETVIYGETGFKFPPGDHNSLANIIVRLLKDKDERDRLSSSARKRMVENFSKKKQINRISQLIRQ